MRHSDIQEPNYILSHGHQHILPIHLWNQLLLQMVLTLNLIWAANVASTMLAWKYIHGQFDFVAHPIAPMSMQSKSTNILTAKNHGRSTQLMCGISVHLASIIAVTKSFLKACKMSGCKTVYFLSINRSCNLLSHQQMQSSRHKKTTNSTHG